MRNLPTWYPGADNNMCSGSNRIAIEYPDRDGKVTCAACHRKVGLRNPRTKQIAMHRHTFAKAEQPVISVDIETQPLEPGFIRKPIPEALALFEHVTGISTERVIAAVGKPKEEQALMREVSKNAEYDFAAVYDYFWSRAAARSTK